MGIRADSTRTGSGFRASRAHAHRAVPYPYPTPNCLDLDVVVDPSFLAQSFTNNAGGGRAKRRCAAPRPQRRR